MAGLVACAGDGSRLGEQRRQSTTTNGVNLNGVNLNGVNLNGVNLNGVNLNGLPFDEIMQSALQSNAVTETGAIEGELAEVLLQYIYSCAMPAGESLHVAIDNGGDDSKRNVDVTLAGAIGLAPEWGVDGGECGVECQRWISACLLARANALGQSVEISMRGPHEALAVSDAEAAEFPLFEGAFYGNLFAAEPQLRGCTGPASSLAALTARMCAEAGGDCPIEVYTDCYLEPVACSTQYHSCETQDSDGAVLGCHDESFACDGAPDPAATRYDQVVTVYLREPLASCGNDICEAGESVECPADCAGWARRFGGFAHDDPTGGVAVDAAGNVITAGYFTGTVDFADADELTSSDGSDLFVWKQAPDGSVLWISPFDTERAMILDVAVDAAGNIYVAGWYEGAIALGEHSYVAAGREGFVASLDPDGAVRWAHAFTGDATAAGVTPTLDGGAAVTGQFWGTMTVDGTPVDSEGGDDVFVAVFGADGALVRVQRFGDRSGSQWGRAIAADDAGNLFVAGLFVGRLTLGGKHTLSEQDGWDAFVFSLDPAGNVRWSSMITGSGGSAEAIRALAVDSTGAVIAGGYGGASDAFVVKYAGTGGALWTAPVAGDWRDDVTDVAVDAEDYVLVAGEIAGASTIGGAPVVGGLFGDAFAAKLRPDTGATVWAERYGAGANDRASGIAAATGDVVVAGSFRGAMLARNHYVASDGGNGSMATGDGFVVRFADPVASEPIAVDPGETSDPDQGPGRPKKNK